MAHWILGYPDYEESKNAIQTFANSGCEILELQIPFSEPSADGHLITQANRQSLAQGMTLKKSFSLLEEIRIEFPKVPIAVMTYFNKVYSFGISEFLKQLHRLNISYLIVPDLSFDEYKKDFEKFFLESNVQYVPVIASNIREERLKKILHHPSDFIYLMTHYGITGSTLNEVNFPTDLIQELRKKFLVGAGFGIHTTEKIQSVSAFVDFVILGSALIEKYNHSEKEFQNSCREIFNVKKIHKAELHPIEK